MRWIWIIPITSTISFASAFGAGFVLLQVLARPWRRSAEQHWSERARLAYAPGMAILLLGAPLALIFGLFGEGALLSLTHNSSLGTLALFTHSTTAIMGVLVVRYVWLRELWGPRVTVRSWLAGILVIVFAILPGFFVAIATAFALPDTLNARAIFTCCGAVLTVAFLAAGGELRLFGWAGILKPAPEPLTDMVQRLADQMHVNGKVRVFVLEWAMVNALAWQRNRAIAFTRPLLEVMTEGEVRAVAAHELGHLLEPAWARRVRTAHLFAYLPPVLLAKYGGSIGLLTAGMLFWIILLAYIRFSHRFEQAADQAESQAISDPGAYALSMTVLHRSNSTPAVMPGKQTHPHLYDRLLAGGVQPDFPRPLAPSRVKPFLAVIVTTAAVMTLLLALMVGVMLTLRLLGYDVKMKSQDKQETLNR
jgi:Zn-dependent protease with chaperone function